MSIINNKDGTLQDALKEALKTADRVDIAVGFFYFSGFEALAEQLKDKKMRILVGLEVDPALIPQITQQTKDGGDIDLSKWQPRSATKSRTALKLNYIDSFVGFMNDSDIFDSDKSNALYDLYIEKINNGTLEIRKTINDYHGKLYLIHNKEENAKKDGPGTMFFGSSNLSYRGLKGQGELNRASKEMKDFDEFQEEFDKMWSDSDSISIADVKTKEEFIRAIKPRIWKYSTPLPYHIYIRVLHELFKQEEINTFKTPKAITNGVYGDFEYQIDAIKMVIDKLNKYDGVILADVVGLGKSIIASAVARNMDIKTVIIAPPHLNPQWEDYKEDFGIKGSKVFSSGKISEVYERYSNNKEPILFIMDEAHRYRNEDTDDYKMLHQVCRSHPDNKVLLLTATPFNNDPKDVFALIKLFQTPGQSTIRSVDNLSLRYRELIKRYKKLRRNMATGIEEDIIDKESEEIAAEQRRLIEPVIVRRSRLDLKTITRYREDLEKQGIDFAKVELDLIKYDLGDLSEIYTETLEAITETDENGFIGARYKSAIYIKDEKRKEVIERFKKELDEETDLKTAQTNLSKFMRRLLVMRFESSKNAFKSTLENMIESNKKVENWWDKFGAVPIMKKGHLPDPEDYEEIDGEENELKKEIELLKEKKGFLQIEKEMIDERFIIDVRHDTELLESIHKKWFGGDQYKNIDPKLDEIEKQIRGFLARNKSKKIIIFSTYKDTVDYLFDELKRRGFDRVAKYTASESTEAYKKVIKFNFDASMSADKQKDNFDILIATDALSEGFNLHRAGIVINYDIPYNPTRVIQRVGRINRINKKVFDCLNIYNCFPTSIGEEETRIRSISTLKMKLINAVVGSDTKTLTNEEDIKSFYKDEYDKANRENEQLSWDAKYRDTYYKALKNEQLMKLATSIPRRTRIKREKPEFTGVVVFGKKGQNTVFTFGENPIEAKVISSETSLKMFDSLQDEKGEVVDNNFVEVFNLAKDKLFAKHELPEIKGRRIEAIKVLKVIAESLSSAKDYCGDIILIIKTLDDISDGSLKDIAQLNLKDIDVAYETLQGIVPEVFVRNILRKSEKTDEAQELLLFAEQFK